MTVTSARVRESWASTIARNLGAAGAYFLLSWLALQLTIANDQVVMFWPASGLALALLMDCGWTTMPGIVLGVVLINLWADYPWPWAVGLGAARLIGPVISWLALRSQPDFRITLERQRDVVIFLVFGPLLAPWPGAVLGTFLEVWRGEFGWPHFGEKVFYWWISSAAGMLVVAPPLLTMPRWRRELQGKTLQAILLLVLISTVCVATFAVSTFASRASHAVLFLVFPMVLWSAMAFGSWTTSTVTLWLTLLGIMATISGAGPFARLDTTEALLHFWSFQGVIVVSALVIAAVLGERARALNDLANREAHFRELAETVRLIPWEADVKNKRFTYVGPQAQAILGYPLSDWQQPGFWERAIFEADHEEAIRFCATSMLTLDHYEFEYRMVAADGRILWMQEIVHVVREGKEARRLRGFLIDVTDRRAAEAAVRNQETILRAFVEHAPAAVIMFDTNMRYLVASKRWFADFGMTENDLRGKSNFNLLPHLGNEWRAIEQRCLAGAVEARERDLLSRGDGVFEWMRWEMRPWKQDNGSIGGLILFTEIITAKVRAEEAQRESEERFRRVFEEGPLGIALITRNLQLLRVNRALRIMFGYSDDEMAGKPLRDFIHPDEVLRGLSSGSSSVEGKPASTFTLRCLRKNGATMWVNLTMGVIHASDGQVAYGILMLEDITGRKQGEEERQRLERKLQEAQKLESLGVLAGGIAHDFNNLLTGILGNTSLAQMECQTGSPAMPFLKQIENATLRAADLSKQMLAYSGRGRFVIDRLDLSQIVEDTTHLLKLSISKKAVLKFELARHLPPIQADATQIRQIIMNLVINASEAIGDKSGFISVSTGVMRADRAYLLTTVFAPDIPEGYYVFLEITDNGCGMSEETKARIFDPFFTTKFTGRGLGLAAVLGIVRGHKGALKVYSEPGRGTTFRLLLPAAEEMGEIAKSRPAPVAAWRGYGAVLVVDDEETIRAVTSRMLENFGFRVLLAQDGREGVALYRENLREIRLVLLDLTMPHLDGEETFRELRRLKPDVKAVIMSGFSEQDATSRFVGKGLAGFIQKPFKAQELEAKLREILSPGPDGSLS